MASLIEVLHFSHLSISGMNRAFFAGPIISAFGFWAGDLLLVGILVIGIVIVLNLSPLLWFKKKVSQDENGVIPEKVKVNGMVSEDVSADEDEIEEIEVVPQPKLKSSINLTQSNRVVFKFSIATKFFSLLKNFSVLILFNLFIADIVHKLVCKIFQ